MKAIEMKLCPKLSRIEEAKTMVIETKDGIEVFVEDKYKSVILEDYAVLKGTFEEKVKILEDYEKNNKIFFSPYAPSARFRVVEY